MSDTPSLVPWRLRHGSLCFLCPLNGRRKVGADGPPDAPHIVIGDVPSEDEETYGAARGVAHGRAFSDRPSYWWKLEFLVPNGLAEKVERTNSKWPWVRLTKVQVMNVAMCRDPEADPFRPADSPTARAARRCCANSLRAWLRRRLAENPDLVLHPQGDAALSDLRREKVGIDAYRGRFLGPVRDTVGEWQSAEWQAELRTLLTDEPEETIIKYVLRGRKVEEPNTLALCEWLAALTKWHRKIARHLAATEVKFTKTGLAQWGRLYDRQVKKATRMVTLKGRKKCTTPIAEPRQLELGSNVSAKSTDNASSCG